MKEKQLDILFYADGSFGADGLTVHMTTDFPKSGRTVIRLVKNESTVETIKIYKPPYLKIIRVKLHGI